MTGFESMYKWPIIFIIFVLDSCLTTITGRSALAFHFLQTSKKYSLPSKFMPTRTNDQFVHIIPNHFSCDFVSSSWRNHKKQRKDRLCYMALPGDEEDINIEYEEVEEDEEISDEDLLASAGKWDEKVAKYNVVHLTGRVGSVNDIKYLSTGKAVISLALASTRKYHWLERKLSSISEKADETDWYPIEVWGPKAEFISKFVDKGCPVSVIGQLRFDSWTDKDTLEPRTKPKIIARDFEVLETKAQSEMRRKGKSSSYTNNGGDSNMMYSNSRSNSNSNKNNQSFQGERERGRSILSHDDDDYDDSNDLYNSRSAGTGGFFDR